MKLLNTGTRLKTSILTPAALLIVASATVYAGGTHEGGHSGMSQHQEMMSGDHGAMMGQKSAMHNDSDHHEKDDDHASMVGQPMPGVSPDQVIKVSMEDSMRFVVDKPINVRNGEVVKFILTNNGQMNHEFSIGSKSEQMSHQKMMANNPGMMHQDGSSITVKPGETKEITWEFKGHKEVIFACNIPGHYQAGMHMSTTIEK
jgi:uncharacterized cupredoxin-like copper-binding protein